MLEQTYKLKFKSKARAAFALSLGMHVSLFLAAVFLWIVFQNSDETEIGFEADRSVEIVLISHNSSFEPQSTFEDEVARDSTSSIDGVLELQNANKTSDSHFPDIELPSKKSDASIGHSNFQNQFKVTSANELSESEFGKVRNALVIERAGVNREAELIDEERKMIARREDIGEPATISLFDGKPCTGHKFMFLLDCSKSMSVLTFNRAKKEILACIARLESNHKFQIMTYNERTKMVGPRRLLRPTLANLNLARESLQILVARAGTAHDVALFSALSKNPDVIYLITDGGDPALTDGKIRQIKEFGGKTIINTIQIGGDSIAGFLEKLARECGGESMSLKN